MNKKEFDFDKKNYILNFFNIEIKNWNFISKKGFLNKK
jgi:hypothetical protein